MIKVNKAYEMPDFCISNSMYKWLGVGIALIKSRAHMWLCVLRVTEALGQAHIWD